MNNYEKLFLGIALTVTCLVGTIISYVSAASTPEPTDLLSMFIYYINYLFPVAFAVATLYFGFKTFFFWLAKFNYVFK